MQSLTKSLATTALSLLFAFPAFADDAPNYKQETLTGDWGGIRTALSDKGIDTSISYTFDVMGNVPAVLKKAHAIWIISAL